MHKVRSRVHIPVGPVHSPWSSTAAPVSALLPGRRETSVNIVDALADPNVFGGLPQFANLTSWARWIVFLKAAFGLPMSADELGIFATHTRRRTPRTGGYPEAVAMVGVQ